MPHADRSEGVGEAFEAGAALHQSGQLTEAEKVFREILNSQPAHFDSLHRLGVICSQRGDHEQAVHIFDAALKLRPESSVAFHDRAAALLGLHRLDEALASCNAALATRPHYAEALNRRGVVLAMLRRFDEALTSLESALAITPASAEGLTNRGNVLGELGRFEDAIASYDQAISLNPEFFGARYCRALALAELGRFDEALASLEKALSIAPGNADAWTQRGNVLYALNRFEEALASYERAMSVGPAQAKILNDRGAALAELGRFDEAIADYDKALSMKPDSAATLNNRGLVLMEFGRLDEALASYRTATSIQPDFAEAHFDESLCRLLLGDFLRGWEKYEWRLKRRDRRSKIRDFPQPRWFGEEDIDGKTILLHTEQGFGDTIQFSRYASLTGRRGARTVLVVQPALRSLMASLSGRTRVLAEGEPIPPFDLHCPLPSLPLAFRTTLRSIPAEVPYLRAPEERIASWRARLGRGDALRIGIAWSGHALHRRDRVRSIPLRHFGFIAGLDCQPFSLQPDIRDADREAFERIGTIRHFPGELMDFCDTAALASLMDVVISADTSVAHLAGAVGKPVWILLPHVPDWRWLMDREDSPWYPTARLFRQPRPGDWKSVVARVAEELRRLKAVAKVPLLRADS